LNPIKTLANAEINFLNYEIVFRKNIVAQFHQFYYDSLVWEKTSWLGVPIKKCPLDLMIYQEIIFESKPDTIIECGTASGGSALFLASICDLHGNGKIITIDIDDVKGRPKHKRINYVIGSSTSKETVGCIEKFIDDKDKVMVILDSDHRKNHVIKELRIYSRYVSKGYYLIVEDSNINGHPVLKVFGPGPMEAIDEFLVENANFVVDTSREKFYLTFNPKGYLKRIK